MITIRSQVGEFLKLMSRRDVIKLGLSGGLANGAQTFNNSSTAVAADSSLASPGRARSCIVVYLYGGPSHLDIWDMKPDAPVEVRGEFRPIATRAPGVEFTEHLPKLAARADRLAIVRSLTHDSPSHGSACHQMLTGHVAARQGEIPPTPEDAPHVGSVLSRLASGRAKAPPFVSLPWRITTQVNLIPGQDAGLLGRAFDPVCVKYDDPQGERFLLPSPGTLEAALKLEHETDATRERYGRNVFGQSMLLARRLVEAGVRVVTVYWPDRKDEKALVYNGMRQPVSVPMWDTHGSSTGDTANFASLKDRLLPPLDLASSALLDDLSADGRLNDTLVVWMGEFGRSPRIQGDGRGHYSKCFSAILAGGGVRAGSILGASDATGSTPLRDPVTPGDFLATVYHLLGVPADTMLADGRGQARRIATGQVIRGLLG